MTWVPEPKLSIFSGQHNFLRFLSNYSLKQQIVTHNSITTSVYRFELLCITTIDLVQTKQKSKNKNKETAQRGESSPSASACS